MRFFVAIFILLLTLYPAAAQPPTAPLYPDHPTVNALAAARMPHHNRITMSTQLLGIIDLPTPPNAAAHYVVGTQEQFYARVAGFAQVETFSAAVRAIGDHLVVWADVRADMTDEAATSIAMAFDTQVYNAVRNLWGSERTPGIDGDPRLHVLFIRAGSDAGYAAYYAREHSYPAEIAPFSNERELFIFNLDALRDLNPDVITTVLAHEFQHMIRDNVQPTLDNWLDEGYSMFTQHVLFGDFAAALAFLDHPDTQLNAWNDALGSRAANYGAALLFTTYIHQRYGLSVLQAAGSIETGFGLDALDAALQAYGAPGINEVFADWVLANALQETSISDGRYGYATLPPNLPRPVTVASTNRYPFTQNGQARQYSADYLALDNLPDTPALTIRLTMPEATPLIDIQSIAPQRENGEWDNGLWYSNRGDESAPTLTRSFDLRGVASATLRYRVWYALEPGYDYGYLLVSDDNGATWDIMSTSAMTNDISTGISYGAAYNGTSDGWRDEAVDLSTYTGRDILVRFAALTDDAVTLAGMAIDDVRLEAVGYNSDFENDGGGWSGQGWVWAENQLPQRAWVQAIQHTGGIPVITRWLAQGDGEWLLVLADDVQRVTLVVSPFAPVTLATMRYEISITSPPLTFAP
ncbi:MAG: immune inhibitor A [Chloroflexota bacterium]|nr:immune inhibitor A [Chloroflexota bacterium]